MNSLASYKKGILISLIMVFLFGCQSSSFQKEWTTCSYPNYRIEFNSPVTLAFDKNKRGNSNAWESAFAVADYGSQPACVISLIVRRAKIGRNLPPLEKFTEPPSLKCLIEREKPSWVFKNKSLTFSSKKAVLTVGKGMNHDIPHSWHELTIGDEGWLWKIIVMGPRDKAKQIFDGIFESVKILPND